MALTPFFGRDPFFGDLGRSTGGTLFDPFSSWFSDVPQAFSDDARAVAKTNVDWRETADAHIFKADFPGLKKEEVKVSLEDGRTLRIEGERKREAVDDNDRWHRVERSMGRFMRRFALPENAKVDQIKAQVENGVLTVTVPKEQKQEGAAARQIDIQ
eukprot:TRINITY_DN1392_c0_g1_i1.p1 TRINITY_DN1392_c0_g1~~TRINITY_DN1392_c0_g1_i1.p1  ORF type:complete len:157 (-),score=50.57 TRINITY_DN1392_c0_g1_i1:403-873(-)